MSIDQGSVAPWGATAVSFQRLRTDPPARVGWVQCGEGSRAIAIALAYPNVRVDGFDPHDGAIAEARRLAGEADVDDRVRFEVADSAAVAAAEYDVIVVPSDATPVDVAALRGALNRDGFIVAAHLVPASWQTSQAGPPELHNLHGGSDR